MKQPSHPVWTIRHTADRRLVRVGACTVLEVTVTYPILTASDGDSFQTVRDRFNNGYRVAAEAFLSWGAETYGKSATADFAAAGPGAVYTFDRRLLSCRFVAEADPQAARLTVTRTVTCASRRGTEPPRRAETVDLWRLFDLSPIRR